MEKKNGFMIHDWMIHREKLSGNYLTCSAFLYHETDGGKERYRGGYELLAMEIGVTTPSIYNILRKLSSPARPLVDASDMKSIRLIVYAK